MISCIIEIPLHPGTTRDHAHTIGAELAPVWRRMPGLLRLYLVVDDIHSSLLAFTVWVSKADASRLQTVAFQESLHAHFGTTATIRRYETVAVADNFAGDVFRAAC